MKKMVFIVLTAMVFVALLAPTASASDHRIPVVVSELNWSTTIYINNRNPESGVASVTLTGNGDQILNTSIGEIVVGQPIQLTFAPLETKKITVYKGKKFVGIATSTSPTLEVFTSSDLSLYDGNNILQSWAGVMEMIPTTNFSIRTSEFTGLALVNPAENARTAVITMRVLNSNGDHINTREVVLQPGDLVSQMLSESAYSIYTVDGNIDVSSNVPVLAGAFAFQGSEFSTTPLGPPFLVAWGWGSLSEEAKALIRPNFQKFQGIWGSGLKRWNSTINVHIGELSRQTVEDALAIWVHDTQGKVSFRLVDDTEAANIRIELSSDPALIASGKCGGSGLIMLNDKSELILNYIKINSANTGCYKGEGAILIIAHEVGHSLGLLAHSPDGTDLMSPGPVRGRTWPPRVGATNWMYSASPGVKEPK